MSRPLVIDASLTLNWLLPDELTEIALAVRAELPKAGSVWVPALWHLEVANALCMAERRKRLSAAGVAEAVSLFSKLPVTVDAETSLRAGAETLALARQHLLSVYDAAYLEIALRRGAVLASLDRPLRLVAKKLAVAMLPKELPNDA